MNSQQLPLHLTPFLPGPWHEALTRRGFRQRYDCYQLNGVSLRSEDRWLAFESALPSVEADSLPGLWKKVTRAVGQRAVFEFPKAAVSAWDASERAEEYGTDATLDSVVAWALASKAGELPDGWRPPERDRVASWMRSSDLTVDCGQIACQGELILTKNQWALRFPILPNLPLDLPAARRAWLHYVLADAQSLWRMVRVGVTGDAESPAVVASVDFSGAPHLENLFSAGLDGVRHAVACLAEAVSLLADASVASEVLAMPPCPNPNRKESR